MRPKNPVLINSYHCPQKRNTITHLCYHRARQRLQCLCNSIRSLMCRFFHYMVLIQLFDIKLCTYCTYSCKKTNTTFHISLCTSYIYMPTLVRKEIQNFLVYFSLTLLTNQNRLAAHHGIYISPLFCLNRKNISYLYSLSC